MVNGYGGNGSQGTKRISVQFADQAGNESIITTKDGKAILELTDSPVFVEPIVEDEFPSSNKAPT